MFAVGLRATELVAEVDEKLPGIIVTLVAPEVAQLSVVLLPAVIDAGLAENEEIVGIGTCGIVGNGAVQLVSPAQARRPPKRTRPRKMRLRVCRPDPDSLHLLKLTFPFERERGESMRNLSTDFLLIACRASRAGWADG